MSGLNPLSFNAWVQNVGVMAVALTQETAGVYGFVDQPLQTILPSILNYAEGRIQRDLDLLAAQTSNTYTLTPGNFVFPLPVNDFLIVNRVSIQQLNGDQVISTTPLTQVSQEYIQNVYGGLAASGPPQFYAMTGDSYGDGADTNNNIAFGPTPNYPYTIRVHGLIRTPSLYTYATAGSADTEYTYISQYYPDMLLVASMIYITMYQRNFSATSDDPQMGQSYEKQYQALRLGAIEEENRKKGAGSAWTGYGTPTSATPTR